MTSLIEPLMMVVVGGMVGFLLIAMYLPIFDIAGKVSNQH
jgi:type IV pilus assembly protein PilC